MKKYFFLLVCIFLFCSAFALTNEQIESFLAEIKQEQIEFENLVCGEKEKKEVYASHNFSWVQNTSDCFTMTAGRGCAYKECLKIAEARERRAEIFRWSCIGLIALVCLILIFPFSVLLKRKFYHAKKKINFRRKQSLGQNTLDDVFEIEKQKNE